MALGGFKGEIAERSNLSQGGAGETVILPVRLRYVSAGDALAPQGWQASRGTQRRADSQWVERPRGGRARSVPVLKHGPNTACGGNARQRACESNGQIALDDDSGWENGEPGRNHAHRCALGRVTQWPDGPPVVPGRTPSRD